MIEIRITGMESLQRNLAVDIPKQIRYATMQTINDCAKAVQAHQIEKQLPGKLTLRSKGSPWWKPGTRFGVNIRPYATRDNPRAVVGSQADWLKLQEQGGTKKAGGHRLAIEAGARPGKTAVLPRALKPRQLLRRSGDVTFTRAGKRRTSRSNGRGFIIPTRSGPAIFVRESDGLKLMYMLEQSATIPPILEFFVSGKELVDAMYQRTFEANFNRAMQTARTK